MPAQGELACLALNILCAFEYIPALEMHVNTAT